MLVTFDCIFKNGIIIQKVLETSCGCLDMYKTINLDLKINGSLDKCFCYIDEDWELVF